MPFPEKKLAPTVADTSRYTLGVPPVGGTVYSLPLRSGVNRRLEPGIWPRKLIRAHRIRRESVGVGTGNDCGNWANCASVSPSPDAIGSSATGSESGPVCCLSSVSESRLASPSEVVAAARTALLPALAVLTKPVPVKPGWLLSTVPPPMIVAFSASYGVDASTVSESMFASPVEVVAMVRTTLAPAIRETVTVWVPQVSQEPVGGKARVDCTVPLTATPAVRSDVVPLA